MQKSLLFSVVIEKNLVFKHLHFQHAIIAHNVKQIISILHVLVFVRTNVDKTYSAYRCEQKISYAECFRLFMMSVARTKFPAYIKETKERLAYEIFYVSRKYGLALASQRRNHAHLSLLQQLVP